MRSKTPTPAAPEPLPENAGLAFIGETAWTPAVVTASEAATLAAARNPTGRPNSDVLRSFVGKSGKRLRKSWQIDFPPHYREQEAALHEKPFAQLKKKCSPASGSWWINPRAQPPLRHALARLDRFLATALASPEPAWEWIESEQLPDDTLLVVARDDDFTHAVLQSAAFTTWWRAHCQKTAPDQVVASFPFPWPPVTPLGSLTKAQQEIRSSITRALLGNDAEQTNSRVVTAYGWRPDLEGDELLTALNALHRRRRGQ